MAAPIRNLPDTTPGQITSSPAKVLNRLAIRVLPIHGIKSVRRGKR